MRQYEVTFIVDPVLSAEEIKSTADTYIDQLKNEGSKIVHIDELGLKQLAYPINRRSSGIYYCVEFQSETGSHIPKMELAFRRDERIMRFLTVSLDKYGVKYNEDKRNGLIGSKKKKEEKEEEKAAPVKAAPAKAAAPAVAEKAAPVVAAAAVTETAAVASGEEE